MPKKSTATGLVSTRLSQYAIIITTLVAATFYMVETRDRSGPTGCVACRNRSLQRCYTEAPLSLLRVSRSDVCTGPFVCPPFIPYSNRTSKMTLPSYQITQSVPLQNLPGLFDRQVYEDKPLALAHTASNSYFGIATHKINQENFTVEGCCCCFLLVLKIL